MCRKQTTPVSLTSCNKSGSDKWEDDYPEEPYYDENNEPVNDDDEQNLEEIDQQVGCFFAFFLFFLFVFVQDDAVQSANDQDFVTELQEQLRWYAGEHERLQEQLQQMSESNALLQAHNVRQCLSVAAHH